MKSSKINLIGKRFHFFIILCMILMSVLSCQIQKKTYQNFVLESYVKIEGVGAASGLIFKDNRLYIISDNSDVLYEFEKKTKKLNKISLREDGKMDEGIRKKEKSDFEAISYDENFYIWGSGSKASREKQVIFNFIKNDVQLNPMKQLYAECKSVSGINNEDFNIEGAIVKGNTLLLFNRGNGPGKKNGIFKIENWQNTEKKIIFYSVRLPEVKNTTFGFTDAIKIGNQIYFLAAAEGVDSNYLDGAIMGSILGIIVPLTMKINKIYNISNTHKFEGIAHYKTNKKNHTFLLCQDPDNGLQETEIFRISIPL